MSSEARETSTAPSVANLFDLTGKVAIVTGASGNIGRGIALRLHEAGASVVFHGSTREAPVVGLEDRNLSIMADVERDAESICTQTVNRFGRIDYLVNNAGIQPVKSIDSISTGDMAEMFRVNVGGVAAMTNEAAKHMHTNDAGVNGRGSIVNISSIEGLQPAFMHSHYCASKAAVIMHTRSAALELGPFQIRVNAVSPGLIAVDGLDESWPEGVARWHAAAPLGRLGDPTDIADAVLFFLSDASRWVTGANLVVDGGVLTHNTW